MTISDFENLEYFSYDEKNHYGGFVFHKESVLKNTDFETMKTLDMIRDLVSRPIVLHYAYHDSGHSSGSLHYSNIGTAVDFHFIGNNYIRQYNLFIEAVEKLGIENMCGIGIYPDWKNPGFHFDLRGLKGMKKSRWGALYVEGEQEYYSMSMVYDYAVNKFGE